MNYSNTVPRVSTKINRMGAPTPPTIKDEAIQPLPEPGTPSGC